MARRGLQGAAPNGCFSWQTWGPEWPRPHRAVQPDAAAARDDVEGLQQRAQHANWGEIGSDTAELLLRALGIEAGEARRLARTGLPAMAAG
jgi:hypothetical protein